jgi:hypothetical protein
MNAIHVEYFTRHEKENRGSLDKQLICKFAFLKQTNCKKNDFGRIIIKILKLLKLMQI